MTTRQRLKKQRYGYKFRLLNIKKDKTEKPPVCCFHCLSSQVAWDSDFSFEDYGFEGEGIVHVCHCNTCGAEIMYCVSDEETDTSV